MAGRVTYYGNINPDLLAWIPLDAGRVLELGCGNAALAAAYRERNPDVHYTAVEMHGPSAEEAATRVDRLLTGDFEAMADEEVTEGRPFDAIVLGDVLGHFAAPGRVVARLATMLADGGHMVVSVPNVGHWSAFYHLFHGRWPADDAGLFDRTHLRFYTYRSLIDMLGAAGLGMVKARPRNFPLDQAKAAAWMPKLADFAEAMGIDRAEFLGRAAALQYVVLARKGPVPPPRLRLAVAALAPRLMEVRARLPADYLQSVPDVVLRYHENGISLPREGGPGPRILIVQRAAPVAQAQWRQMLAEVIGKGWLVVSEWDDHPDLVGRVLGWGPDKDRWQPIRQVHAVQTTTPALAELFRAHNPAVAAFPNGAFALPPLPAERAGPPRVFHGALNRGGHAVAIAAALGEAIAAAPDMAFEVVHDRAFFDALPTDRKRFHETLPYDRYLEVMVACDIALLPLEGRPEELAKSGLKYVEAASRGLAVIASPAVYADTVRDGRTGLIVDTPADWAAALARLAADPGERRRLARAAWQDVRANRMFARQIPERLAWYAALWERRAELHRALLERVPDLAAMLPERTALDGG